MQRVQINLSPVLCMVAALFLLTAKPAEAAVTYFVTVNTSAVNPSSGFLDFQFNPGNGSTQAATATISGFTGGTVVGAPQINGNVSGTLPGTVTFVNSTALNEAFQGFTYGASFSFVLTLSGPAIDTPNGTSTAGSTFGVGLYDNTMTPILTNQGATTGFAGSVNINLNGTTTPTAFPTATNGPSVVTFQALTQLTISKVFGTSPIGFGSTTSLSFTIANPNAGLSLTGVGFTDNLPAGLAVATPNGLTGSCNGTLATAPAGSSTISLAGATVPASGSCTFSVTVVGKGFGVQNNTTTNVTSNEAGAGNAATASVTVVSTSTIPVMSLPALAGFALLLAGLGAFLAKRAQTH